MPDTAYALLAARKSIRHHDLRNATAYMAAYEFLREAGNPAPIGVYRGRQINGDQTYRELSLYFEFTFGMRVEVHA
jgi:hypothetical protein